MRRSGLLLVIGALALGACGDGDEPVAAPSELTAPSGAGQDASSPSASTRPSSSPTTDAPSEPEPSTAPESTTSSTDAESEPDAEVRSEAEALDAITPENLMMGLAAVDPATGAVSWFNGSEFLTFEVDAALDATAWQVDGDGGVLLQSRDRGVWHLPTPSDDPVQLLAGPGEDWSVIQQLVGGGLRGGVPHAYVEIGTVDQPETTSADLVAIDLSSGERTVVEEGITGWESGLGDASIVGSRLLTTIYAEGYVGVVFRDLATDAWRQLGEGELVEIHSALDARPQGVPSAWMLIEEDDFSGWSLLRRDLEGDGVDLDRLPDHPQRYLDLAIHDGVVLAVGDQLTLVRMDAFSPWLRFEADVPGHLMLAPGFALG